jgi:hypothetical protein
MLMPATTWLLCMGLFSIFLVGAAATRCDGTIRKGRRFFRLLPKSWVLVWKGRKFLIFQGGLTDTLSASRDCGALILSSVFAVMNFSDNHSDLSGSIGILRSSLQKERKQKCPRQSERASSV